MATIHLKKVFAALPQTDKGKSVRLSGDPGGEHMLYCNGHNVYIRNVKDPLQVDIYSGHSNRTMVARYSPSRLFVASADMTGKVLVWSASGPGHNLRVQCQALEGLIRDLDWSPDSQRIVVCGNGKDKFVNVFNVEDGSSGGVLEGQCKLVNTCSYRQVRPFAIVTASEDNTVAFHKVLPYVKFKQTYKNHNHYVQVARYSWNGDTIFSGGSDGKLFMYDGKKGEMTAPIEIGSPAHKADIFELCFSPDDKQVVTVSGDRTAKIFDVQSGTLVRELFTGNDSQDSQQGCLWQKDHLVTVNARGHLLYHDMGDTTSTEPLRVVKGHMQPITAMAVSKDGTIIFTGNQEAILQWDVETGTAEEVAGTDHPGDVVDMVLAGHLLAYVCADLTLKFASVFDKPKEGSCLSFSCRNFISTSIVEIPFQGYHNFLSWDSHTFKSLSTSASMDLTPVSEDGVIKLDSAPKAMDAHYGLVIVACQRHVVLVEHQRKWSATPLKSEATCISIHPVGHTVAVGLKDNRVKIFAVEGWILRESRNVIMHDAVSVVSYAPCGAYLAVAVQRRVSALSATDYRELSKGEVHRAPVCCIAWCPHSSCFVTAARDGRVIMWDDTNDSYKKRPSILAHANSHANRIAWLGPNLFVTAGQDSTIKQFTTSA